MLEYEELSASEQISALLDGELDARESGTLFYNLAQNPELQAEMQDILVMKKKFKSMQIAAPEELKNKVLIGAGIGLTAGTATNFLTGTSILQNFWLGLVGSKSLLMGISALVGTILTIGYYSFFPNPNTDSKSQEIAQATNATANQPAMQVEIKSIKAPDYIRNTKIVKEYVYITQSPEIINNNNSIMPNSNLDKSLLSYNIPFSNKLNNNQFFNQEPINYSYNNYSNQIISDEAEYLNRINSFDGKSIFERLSFDIRGFNYSSNPHPNIAPLIDPAFNNIAIGLNYDITQNHTVGILIGQENFPQEFYGKEDGYDVTYLQNYLAFWVGGAYQYSMNPIYGFQPFSRIIAAGTSLGPIGKAFIGIQYKILDKFTIYTGYEAGVLIYKFQDEWFTTRKYGLTYGLSFHF